MSAVRAFAVDPESDRLQAVFPNTKITKKPCGLKFMDAALNVASTGTGAAPASKTPVDTLSSSGQTSHSDYAIPEDDCVLIWSDEFNSGGLNRNKWHVESVTSLSNNQFQATIGSV